MGHAHNVYDADPYFVIDADTRVITDLSETGTSLMQYDHNSERLTFEIDRKVDEHDMSKCDRVEVHYINIGTNGKRSEGVYPVDDLIVDSEDDQIVKFTWLVSQNATMYAGSLSFAIRFSCTTDGVFDYVWNTDIYNKISIGKGLDTASAVVTQYADVLQAWYNEFIAAGNDGVARIENATTNALAEIEKAKDDMIGGLSEDEFVAMITEEATKATMENLDTEDIADVVLTHIKDSTVTTIDASATDEQYPTAKAVYDAVDKASLHGKASGEVIRVDDVNSVVHNVKAKVKSKNLFNAYNCTVSRLTKADDGSFVSAVEDYYYSTIYVPNTIIEKFFYCGNTLTLSVPENPDEGKLGIVVFGTRTNGETYQEITSEVGEKNITITVADDFTEITRVELRVNRRSSTFTDTATVYTQIQLELGDTATEYTPYVDPTTVTVTRCGKNLFPIFQDQTANGVSLTKIEDYYVLNGTATMSGLFVVTTALGAGTYTISANNPTHNGLDMAIVQVYSDTTKKSLVAKDNASYSTYTENLTSAKDYQFRIRYENGVTYNNYIVRPQLELSSTATDYEPYTGATYTPNADGTVDGVTSVSPTMTIFTDKSGVTIEAEYNQDINAAFDGVNALLENLLNGGT